MAVVEVAVDWRTHRVTASSSRPLWPTLTCSRTSAATADALRDRIIIHSVTVH